MESTNETSAQTSSDQKQQEAEPQNPVAELSLSEQREQIKNNIMKELHNLKTVVVCGQAGVGKTRIAREVSREILKYKEQDDNESLFTATLWLSLNKKYRDRADPGAMPLVDLARQLRLLPSIEGGFDDDEDVADVGSDNEAMKLTLLEEKRLKEMKSMEDSISDKLMKMASGTTVSRKKKRVLLTLDGAPDAATVADIMNGTVSAVEPLKSLSKDERLGVLVTRRSPVNDTEKSDYVEDVVEALQKPTFLSLLDEVAEKEELSPLKKNLAAEIFGMEFFQGDRVSLPAAAAELVVKALKHNSKYDNDMPGLHKALESFFKEAAGYEDGKKATAVARLAYNMLPSEEDITECCWHSNKFFGASEDKGHTVHYNELIANWILEGYFDDMLMKHSVEKAYTNGYRVFEQLSARGLLKVQEGEDFVGMDGLALGVQDRRLVGFDKKARLGLPNVFAGDTKWKGLGRIVVSDGMLKSFCRHKKWAAVSTLFVDGERLGREVPNDFFSQMRDSLETLVITNPRLRNLDFLRDSKKLQMLVLRGCDMLENIDAVRDLKSLIVLEVSGGRSLEKLADGLFENLNELRSLNLSGSHVASLPSLEKVTRLRWLVLRDCSKLKEMPNLKEFTDLEVLEVSGVSSLERFKNKNLGNLEKLRAIDFSQCHSAPLPFVNRLKSLTRLTLKDCVELTRLPIMKDLTDLRVLKVPGAKKLKEFYNHCLENKPALEILDLSGSEITHLPESFNHLPKLETLNLSHMSSLQDFKKISFAEFKFLKSLNLSNTKVNNIPDLSNLENLREIRLRDCQNLESLPAMEGLASLEAIDLSGASNLKEVHEDVAKLPSLRKLILKGCAKLEKIAPLTGIVSLEELNLSGCEAIPAEEIEKQPFNNMTHLQDLDLSGTNVTSLKSFCCPTGLRRLSLKLCAELKEIPTLESLSLLEELNLSGSKSVKNGEAKKFKHMSNLCNLDLSETSMLISQGDFAKCTKLRELSLRGCVFVGAKLSLESLTMLEVLDLSEILFAASESPQQSSERRSVSLEDCSGIEKLSKLRKLHLWGFKAKQFPYWISGLTNLESLQLPDLKGVESLDWGQIKRLPDDLNWEECGILEMDGAEKSKIPSVSLTGAKIFQALKQKPEKWDEVFAKFRIYVCPFAGAENDDDVYRLRGEMFYEDLYFETICLPESCKRFLEIRGFEKLPEGLDGDSLGRVDCLSFVEDDFVHSLSDLGVESFEAMSGLWLESCRKTEYVFSGEKVVKLGAGFRILWASNLPCLKSLYNGNVQDQSFKNLSELYLDCCPLVEYVFSGSNLPENLKKLDVKFCEKLSALVKSEMQSLELSFPRLEELYLLELPELSCFGAKFGSLQKANVNGCPKLDRQSFADSIGRKVEIACTEESWEGKVTEAREAFSPSQES